MSKSVDSVVMSAYKEFFAFLAKMEEEDIQVESITFKTFEPKPVPRDVGKCFGVQLYENRVTE